RSYEHAGVKIARKDLRVWKRDLSKSFTGTDDILEQHVRRGVRLARHGNPELTASGERPLNARPSGPARRRALACPRGSLNHHHWRGAITPDEILLAWLV